MKETMESPHLLAALSAFMLLGTLTAPCQESRFYVKGDLGGNLTSDTEGTVSGNAAFGSVFGTQSLGVKARFDPGVHIGVAGGYRVTDWFAAEAELGAIVNKVEPGDGLSNGTFTSVPFLFNVRLQYPSHSRWMPYIGAGVGVSAAILDSDILIGAANGNFYVRAPTTGADAVLAYQAFAGLRYRLNEHMGLNVEYRFLVTGSPEWNLDISGYSGTTVTFDRIETHVFSLAFEYRF